MTEPVEVDDDDLSLEELLPWLEFGCWTALVLAPILYYVNGPSVSTDQAVVRTGLVIAAAVGAATFAVCQLAAEQSGMNGKDTSLLQDCGNNPTSLILQAHHL